MSKYYFISGDGYGFAHFYYDEETAKRKSTNPIAVDDPLRLLGKTFFPEDAKRFTQVLDELGVAYMLLPVMGTHFRGVRVVAK